MSEFKDQIVIVTGGAGGLGSVVAESFAQEGATVVMVDIAGDRLKEISDKIEGKTIPRVVDLTNETDVDSFVSSVKSEFSRIDIIANIAGGFTMGPRTHETELSTFDKMISLNTKTMFLLSKYGLRIMLDQKSGKIVNVGAPAGLEGKGKMGPYCATKSMVIRLTESMAKEYSKDGINVNCILPGTIDTAQNRADMPNADFAFWVKPQELADVIKFLSSDAARAVKGAAVPVLGNTI